MLLSDGIRTMTGTEMGELSSCIDGISKSRRRVSDQSGGDSIRRPDSYLAIFPFNGWMYRILDGFILGLKTHLTVKTSGSSCDIDGVSRISNLGFSSNMFFRKGNAIERADKAHSTSFSMLVPFCGLVCGEFNSNRLGPAPFSGAARVAPERQEDTACLLRLPFFRCHERVYS